MKTTLLFGAILALVVTVGLQIGSLHNANATLRTQVDEMRLGRAKQISRPEPSTPKAAMGSGDEIMSVAAGNEARARLTQLRAEVAALEKQAAEHYVAHTERADALSTNRDPEKGMTRLENMQNVGQGTPAAALQTFFWAVMKGDDDVLARTVVWDEAIRPQVQAMIDRLSPKTRAQYSTPEKLWGLIISKYALDVSAIQIVGHVPQDASHASLTVKGLTAKDEPVPMQLGADGWRLWLGGGQLGMVMKELTGKNE